MYWRVVCLIALGLLIGCQSEAPKPVTNDHSPASSLTATRWLLVNIESMDDSTYLPQAASLYTLEFLEDGKLFVQADCNRGPGSWTSPTPSQLELGPIAMTRMACGPESIDGRFLKDLSYVRSYVIRGGALYLATMADGAILKFVPYKTVTPSFNCDKARGTVEEMICRDAELAQLDLALSDLYQRVLTTSTAPYLKAIQRGWIKGRNDCWKSQDIRACIIEEYFLRSLELKLQAGIQLNPSPVTFACDDNSNIVMYLNQETKPALVVFERSGSRFTAYQVRSASGAHFVGTLVDFWNKGTEATVSWAGDMLNCSTDSEKL